MTREKPILFSAPMVRAILYGSKTQTRRVVKLKSHHTIEERGDGKPWPWMYDGDRDADHWLPCSYGQPGDRLWVRETWMPDAPRNGEWPDTAFYGCGMSPLSLIPECYRHPWHVIHRATYDGCNLVGWKPSIHMPRWASRITLEVTGVRVERLQDISEADAQAEGVYTDPACPAYDAYRSLWSDINGITSWDQNPWVWVIEFRRD